MDLLFTDLVMPGMSGTEFWKRIRALQRLPVLFMSGYSHERVGELGMGMARSSTSPSPTNRCWKMSNPPWQDSLDVKERDAKLPENLLVGNRKGSRLRALGCHRFAGQPALPHGRATLPSQMPLL
jgi:CheY-like chemotaxis protein